MARLHSRQQPHHRQHRRPYLLFILSLLITFTLPAPLLAAEDNWWDDAAEESRDQFNTLKETLSETITELEGLQERINQFEQLAESTLSGQELEDALKVIAAARGSLDDKLSVLKLADGRMGSVAAVIDGAFDLRDLAAAANARRGGPLASSMHLLGEAMKTYGGDVPWVGDFVAYYGEAVGGLLDATDRVANMIDTNMRQGTLTNLGIDDPRVKALNDQFGLDFTANHTIAPADLPFLYEDLAGAQGEFTLIWNPDTGQWTRIDRSVREVSQLYRSYVLAHGRPTIDTLITLATTGYDGAQSRIGTGSAAFNLLFGLSTPVSNFIFDAINRATDYQIGAELADLERFIARFAHDQQFHAQVIDWMRQMYADAVAQGADDVAAQILAWAEQHNIALELEEQTADTDEPASDPNEVTAPISSEPVVAAANYVVILFDASGSMGDNGKINAAKRAARNVLSQVPADTAVALIVFYDCGAIVAEQDFTTDTAPILTKVDAISPSGSTPLADGISFAKGYINEQLDGGKARLVILSDGEETCGGNPVTAAQQ